MLALIVTETHKNRGEVVNLNFTDRAYCYADENGCVYHMHDFVELDSILHELDKADALAEYWTIVSRTISEYLRKQPKEVEDNEKPIGFFGVDYASGNDRTTERYSGESEGPTNSITT